MELLIPCLVQQSCLKVRKISHCSEAVFIHPVRFRRQHYFQPLPILEAPNDKLLEEWMSKHPPNLSSLCSISRSLYKSVTCTPVTRVSQNPHPAPCKHADQDALWQRNWMRNIQLSNRSLVFTPESCPNKKRYSLSE